MFSANRVLPHAQGLAARPKPLRCPPRQPQPQLSAAEAELRQLLAEEEAAKAAERARRTAAQARIAELQALTRYQ